MRLVLLIASASASLVSAKVDAEARFQQGQLHWRNQDRAQAALGYRAAAEAGHGEAMAHLGRMCFRGEGIPRDADMALVWLQKSAALKNPRGLYHLAELYQDGVGVPRNQEQYVRLLEQAAQAGSPDAQAELGQFLWFGHGILRDLSFWMI